MSVDVLVLNASFQPLQILNMRKVLKLVVKGTVEVIKHVDGKTISSSHLEYPLPSVVRLHRYVNYHPKPAPFSKRNVLIRDKFTCQYCGVVSGQKMTIDHVVPTSKGGLNTWENTVACCGPCNAKKDDQSLKVSGMTLKKLPRKPTPYLFMKAVSAHRDWDEFIYM
jgi:5-methylcytosine-specific restriction endonuclease McrA